MGVRNIPVPPQITQKQDYGGKTSVSVLRVKNVKEKKEKKKGGNEKQTIRVRLTKEEF